MGIMNQDGALYMATGIDNSGLRKDAKEASNIINGLSAEVVTNGEKMKSSMDGVGTAIGAIGGTAALGMLGKDILDTTAKFEKFGIVLRNTLGNDAGNDALDMIAQFAATTPFQLDEVTAAFIKMANQGFVPTREELVKLGDLASSTGKSFDQLAEALLDAQTGQFERLKEFGIKASANGDKVTFSFKEQQTTVDNTNSAIQKYILSLGDLQGITGANAKISESLTGQISNLEDKLAAMYNEMGTANKGVLYDAVGLGSMLIENYETVGKVIIGLVGTYGAYRAGLIIANVAEQVSIANKALASAANGGLIAANVTLTASEIAEISALEVRTAAQSLLNKTMLTNPYVAAAVAIAALAGGIYYLATRTTEAQRAHEKLNETAQNTETSIRGERIQVDTLFARLKAAKKGTEEYKSAKDAIMSQYGQYLKGLGDEKTALNNVALAQRTITEEIEKSGRARAMSTATNDASDQLAQTEGKINDKVKKLLDDKFGKDSKQSIDLFAQIKSVVQNGGSVKESFLKLFDETGYQSNGQFGGTTTYVDNELKNLLKKAKQAKQIKEEIVKDAEVKFGSATTQTAVKDKAPVSETPAQLKARLAAEKKARMAAEKQAQKEGDGEYNAKQDLQGLLLDLQNQTANLLLKNSEDNLQTRLAQIELEKNEEVQKVTDKEVSIIDAYNKAHRGDKNFKPLSTDSGSIQASINTIDPALGKKLGAAELDVVNAYGEKKAEATRLWGEEMAKIALQYADERVKVETSYNEDIVKLVQSGELAAAGIATMERDKKISELTAAKIQETDLYKAATNDKLQASKETTEKLIADIKARIVAEEAAGKLSSETAKQMLKDIDSAQTTVAGNKNQNNPFAQLGNAISGNTKAGAALKSFDGKGLTPEAAKVQLANLESESAKATSSMAVAAGAALQGVQSILGSVVGGLSDLGMLTDDQKKTADQVMGMVGGAANLAMGIASGNPMQIIQGSVDMLVNGFKLFDSKTKAAEKEIKKQQGLIDSLKKSYDDLEDSVSKAFSTAKAQLVTAEMQNLKDQNEAITKQIADEKSKKKVDNGALTNYQDAIDANKKKIEELKDTYIEAITGTDVMSAIDSLANAYADVWSSGNDSAKASVDFVSNLFKTALIEKLKNDLQPGVTELMNMVSDAMADGILTADEKAAVALKQKENDAIAARDQQAFADLGLNDSKKSGVTGQLTAATTEATASQLVGLWTMTSLDIRSIKEWLLYGNKVDQAKTVDISASVGVIMENTRQIALNTKLTADNAGRTADNTNGLIDVLKDINNNTKGTRSRG